jgi:hypothetical protein
VICEFFADMLQEGKSFNTIAGYRSAISEIHVPIDGMAIGHHPDITKAMTAVRLENPPKEHSEDLIDISPSLAHISNLGSNMDMSIRQLTIKTAFLLALVTASRPSDLVRIDASSVRVSEDSYTFTCCHPKEYKIAVAHSASTTKPSSKTLFVGSYSEDPSLCPFSAVRSLLDRTSEWRLDDRRQKSLFLITRQPHTPASTDTVAGWIKEIMQRSSASSTARDVRSTSASLAQNSGADLATVLALGNWSSNATYQKFYQRGVKIMLERNKISSRILNEATHANPNLFL